ncbi:hypothetical protein C8J57DRAFT_1429624 [Mycena rebaudengoi]|nr:hypothetical protein C8J57DRAFT_1429624 [Mycena rebaudengoi]
MFFSSTPIDCHVAALSAAVTHPARSSPVQISTNPVDDFFGYTLSSSRTRESRHDSRSSIAASTLSPPPYIEAPEYTQRPTEPCFPPFWIMGVIILLSPLRAPPAATPSAAWLPEKTESERQAIIDRMRAAELKWARRCLYALLALVLVVTVIAAVAWAALRS